MLYGVETIFYNTLRRDNRPRQFLFVCYLHMPYCILFYIALYCLVYILYCILYYNTRWQGSQALNKRWQVSLYEMASTQACIL